jgi:hypothetical protein
MVGFLKLIFTASGWFLFYKTQAEDLGVTRKAINGYLAELKDHKYVDWERRGLGKTNVYYILDYQPLKVEADVTNRLHPNVTNGLHPDVKVRLH